MNWSEQEAIKNLQRSERIGTRLLRGLLWAIVALGALSVLVFLAVSVVGGQCTGPLC